MENQENNNSQLKNIARWIAVVPVAVAGIFVGTIAMNIFFFIQRWFLGASSEGGWAQITFFMVAPAAGAALAVYWGAIVAPKARKVVSMIIGALVVILNTVNVIMAFAFGNPDAWWTIASGVASVIAAGFIVYQFFTEGDDFRLFD
jgi:hypothetical protein